jgi:hypothetical protein
MASPPSKHSALPRSSATRHVVPLVGVFAAVVLCLLLLVRMQIEIMAGVRAYVGGEGLWSKAQKDAVLSLRQFAASGNLRDWRQYRQAIAVPLGDRVARLELEKDHPNPAVVHRGFVAGRNHPDDVGRMAMLFRRFGRVSYMADAIRIWTQADHLVTKLSRYGHTLRAVRLARPERRENVERILLRITVLNARITPLEDAFSRTLGEGARQLGYMLFLGMLVAAALLLSVGALLSTLLLRAVEASRRELEREARISAALARIGQQLISGLKSPLVHERLCELAVELLRCERSSTLLSWKADEPLTVAATDGAAPDPSDVAHYTLATLFTGATSDVALARKGDGAPRLLMALRRGTELVGVQIADFAPDASITSDLARIARGIAHVGSMALANAALVGELEHASQLKSEFVSTMSHELRTPLNVILGYAEMARDGGSPLPADELMARIELSGRDLLGLIESTLEIGKIDAGRDEPRIEDVAFETFWTALGEGCGRLPRRDGVVFEWPN